MNQIINGKRYNTESARKVGGWSNNYPQSDFKFIWEKLYQKRTGEYFLSGEGGAMTKYGESYGDSAGYGSENIPMTTEEAREWAEEKLTAEEYEKEFTVAEEALSPIAEKIKILREAHGLSQAALADKIGISQQAIAGYENGQEMNMGRFFEICKALEITPSEFLK